MFATVVLAAALGAPQCWDIFDGALRRSALADHPAFITYNERIAVTADEQTVLYSMAHVDYRDDGTARVEDERFGFQPFITRHAEPGPPELGPYGRDRFSWVPADAVDGSYPIIARVRVQGNVICNLGGIESYKGHQVYHLIFGNTQLDRPTVKEMWVDKGSQDIWKLTVSGYVYFVDMDAPPPLTDFQVELAYAGPYLVVDHVVWAYRRHEFSQYTNYFGEYTLTGFNFPEALPAAYFGDSGR